MAQLRHILSSPREQHDGLSTTANRKPEERKTVSPSPNPSIANSAPCEASVTDYDRAHLAIYARLLDAAAEGAPWEDVSRIVLGIDPRAERSRAKQAYDTHLARAHWLTAQGYKKLLVDRS
jgi:hypothetical protein